MVKANKGRAKKQLACCEYLDSESRFTVEAGDVLTDGSWKATVVNVVTEGRRVYYTLDTEHGRIYCEPSSSLYGVRIDRKSGND